MKQSNRAFTLLELLTVIGILTLLIGILVPSLSAVRRQAKASACISALSGIGKAFTVYLNENDDHFPPFRLKKLWPGAEEDYVNEFGRRAPRWQWFLETDMGPVIDPKPFRYAIESVGYFDDDTRHRDAPSDQTYSRRMAHKVFTCPSLRDEEYALDIRNGAFGYNYQYLGNTRTDWAPNRWDNFAVGLHRIRSPALTVLVADSRGADRIHGAHSYTLDPPRLAIEEHAKRFGPSSSDVSPRSKRDAFDVDGHNAFQYSPVETRHNKRGNVLFVDSHAAAMTHKELGYQLSSEALGEGLPPATPVPIWNPEEGEYTATNRLWNGQNSDPLADKHRPAEPGS